MVTLDRCNRWKAGSSRIVLHAVAPASRSDREARILLLTQMGQ